MHPTKTSPTYNLGAVIRETGIKADALRAWERRYGLPQPARSAGGQRLYSQRDLEIIKWLIAKQEEGLRISQAAEMWRTQIEDGIDPLAEIKPTENTSALISVEGDNISEFKSQWIAACTSYNEIRAEQIVAEAFSQYSPETVCFEILFAGLSEIGEGWYQGEFTVQQEHFASALVTRRLNALISSAPLPIHSEKIVIASAPEEIHLLPSLLLTFLLRRRGWDVVFLGADVPLVNFRTTLETLQPKLVILISHQLYTAASLLDLIDALNGLQSPVAFGGLIFNQIPELRERIPGHYLGEELKNAVPNIERFLHNPSESKVFSMPDQSPTYQHIISKMPTIESRVSQAIDTHPAMQGINSQYFSRDILAALKLGDIFLSNSNLDWIAGLLANAKVPVEMLRSFLQIYQQTVKEVMGSQGKLVLDWLQSEIDRIS